jgi:opacity protein-like surface antigen
MRCGCQGNLFMTVIRLIALAASMSVAATMANAADLRGRIDPEPLPDYEYVDEFAGGWYIRGDLGIANQTTRGLRNAEVEAPGRVPLTHHHASLSAAPIVGVGIGYQFNTWLRADITGEYRQSRLRGLSTYPGKPFDPANPDQAFWDPGALYFTAKKHDIVGLANAYLDLGNWHGVTPFVGAGLGFAHILIDDFTVDNRPVQANFKAGRGSQTNFAWALHAGTSVDITNNAKLELGYRYLNMGNARHGMPLADAKGNTVDKPWVMRRIESHDFRVGMRWMFAAPAPVAQYWPEEPIVRKF